MKEQHERKIRMEYKPFFFFITLMSMYLTVYFYRLVSGLLFYYVQILVYLTLILSLWSTVEKYIRWGHLSATMLSYTSLSTMVYMLLGFIEGFGFSPYSMSLEWIAINIVYISTKVVGIEFIRVYIIDELILRRRHTTVFLASLMPWLLIWFPYPLLSLTTSLDSLKILFRYLTPSFADSVLSTYIVINHGIVPSLIYNLTPQVLMRILPILPKLHWFVESAYRLMVPLIGYAIMSSQTRLPGVYMRRNKYELPSILKTTRYLLLIFLIMTFSQGYLGLKPYVITSNSMIPVIHTGDIVIVCRFCKDYVVNDIVAYESRWGIIVHRIVDFNREKNLLITKGDANQNTDPEPVSTRNVIGKVVLRIPFLGYLSIFLNELIHSGIGLGAMVLLAPLLVLYVFKRMTSY